MGRGAQVQEPAGALPASLLRPIAVVRRRIRTQRALDAGAWLLSLAIAGVLAAVAAHRLGLIAAPAAAWGLLAWLALPLLGAALGALRPLPALMAPRLLDRAHGTNDLLSSALSFGQLSAEERTPFMDACVASAARAAEAARPAQAAPLVAPRALRLAAALLVGTAVAVLLPERSPPPIAIKPAAPRKPRLLQQEDVALVSAELAPLLPALEEDPALAPLRKELNALLEALKDEQLERAEALLALRELQERLALDELAADQSAHDEALRELGKQLAGGGPEHALAEALTKADAEQAQKEAEQLAQKLGAAATKQDASLERALRKASERPAATEQAREQARRERERLLQKKQDASPKSPEQERLLKKKERELDQLERELEQKQEAERSLDELRRELGDSAKSMSERNREAAQEHMQRAAQSLKQQAKKKLSAEQRAALAQKLEQLRELISKQRGQQDGKGKDGKDGKGQQGQGAGEPQAGEGQQRLDLARFGKLARGQGGGEGDQPGEGDKPGEGGQPKLLVPGQAGEGQSSLMLPGEQGEQSESSQDAPNARGGSRAGTGGRPELQAEASARSGQHVDTRVEGEHGEGPTRSQVIHEAGQRGFASLPYQQVHTEYARHAERVLERDHVPGGYKFYVRRYFQLIRPREEAP